MSRIKNLVLMLLIIECVFDYEGNNISYQICLNTKILVALCNHSSQCIKIQSGSLLNIR